MSLIFAETTTFGARTYRAQRRALPRESVNVTTTYGDVRIKLSRVNGRILHVAPEYDDCRKLATEKNVPLQQVIAKPYAVTSRSRPGNLTTRKGPMPQEKPKYYLTTPIYYTNGLPHIGHVYTTIVCDTIRRFKRMRGYDVVMTTGTDEHGVNVERSAKKAGIPESEFVARMAAKLEGPLGRTRHPGDEFIRTTDIRHVRTVQWLFRLCRENGYIYQGHYIGQYCIYDNAYVRTSRPAIRVPTAAARRKPLPKKTISSSSRRFRSRCSTSTPRIRNFIQPETRRNEIISFVEGGLKDLSITRTTIRWGIPVPGEEPHVFYVWFDALTSYLSAVGGPEYERRGYWPADVHVVGKDIIRFHAVYWPAFLMAAGLPLPKQVWAHGWLLMDSAKMSKSKGNVVRATNRRCPRHGPASLLSVARHGLRSGRQLQLRRACAALQQRPRQWPGQSGQPHRGDDREELRRQNSETRCA